MLMTGEYLTAGVLAQALCVSSKTVRNQIKSLNEILKEYDACIESKHGTGFRLTAKNPERIKELEQSMWNLELRQAKIPDSSEERIMFLAEYLLGADDYVKLDELSDLLYISKRTLTGNLKEVEEILKRYHLTLRRKPNYGIRIEGREFERRLCIADDRFQRSMVMGQMKAGVGQAAEITAIQNCIREGLKEYPLVISGLACRDLVMHILIAIRRMQGGRYIEETDSGLNPERNKCSWKLAKKILDTAAPEFGVKATDGEITYLAVHLEGKQTITGSGKKTADREVSELVSYMLNAVYDAFRFDLRDDAQLRTALSQHLGPLTVRLQYDMKLVNPLLKEIKEHCSLSYTMATTACVFLNYRYHTVVREEEIGYIALLFALALERKKANIAKKNVLLVTSMGRGYGQLLQYRYQTEFREYINSIRSIDVLEIENCDFTDVDYLFTTVPINERLPVPVLKIHHFLGNADMGHVKKALTGKRYSSVTDIYREELFLSHMRFKCKDQALEFLCSYVGEHGYADNGLINSVKARESVACTVFENHVAMPHPIAVPNEKPFVLVALLDEPLQWLEYDAVRMVQAIFLVSVGNSEGYDAQKFYQVTVRLFLDENKMIKLIRNQDYGTLTALLKEEEQQADQYGN